MENEYIIQVKDVHIKYKTVQAESIKKSLFSISSPLHMNFRVSQIGRAHV